MKGPALIVNGLLFFGNLTLGNMALAAGDMLTPDEVKTDGISANPANDSGLFIGAGMGFGQARSTEGDGSPGLAWLMSFEPGYQANTGSWSRVEMSGQFLFGRLGFNTGDALGDVTMPTFGMLLKAGYGYSLGSKLFGIARVGVGPVMADFEGEVSGTSVESTSMLSGIATELAWNVIAPVNDKLDFVGGIAWMHMEFAKGKIKNDAGTTDKMDRAVIVNIPQAELGLRLRL